MQNRRDFLKTSALAAAGMALVGCTGGPERFNIVKGDGRMLRDTEKHPCRPTWGSRWPP